MNDAEKFSDNTIPGIIAGVLFPHRNDPKTVPPKPDKTARQLKAINLRHNYLNRDVNETPMKPEEITDITNPDNVEVLVEPSGKLRKEQGLVTYPSGSGPVVQKPGKLRSTTLTTVVEASISGICASAVSLIPSFVPKDIAYALCTEGFNLGVRNPRKLADFAITAFNESKNMVKKAGSKLRGPKNKGKAVVSVQPAVSSRTMRSTGVVSTTAPVSIGNTISGVATKGKPLKGGHVVRGREFLTTAYGSGSLITWTMVAGVPLTPVTFVDSLLRMYGSMYDYFKWTKLEVHYVTTSPTSSTGSIMLYYHKDRGGVFLNQTSANLLPFVLSDPHTCIGPQWQNMSVVLETDSEWKRTDYGNGDDMAHYSAGELFLLSKTAAAATESPGYLLMDYEIQFKDLNLTPRLLVWPQPTIIYNPYSFQTTSQTAGSNFELIYEANQSHNPFGVIANGLGTGRVYKVILDLTNTNNATANTNSIKASMSTGGATFVVNLQDGTTLYAVCVNSTTSFRFYLNVASAYTGSANELALWNATASDTTYYVMWFSLVGIVSGLGVNPSM